jgi:hypothetical protein
MRSDFNHPLALTTFFWAAPALVLMFGWAIFAGILRTLAPQGRAASTRSAEQVAGQASEEQG